MMKIIGYVARYADGEYAHPYGERGIRLYRQEGVAQHHNKKAEILPVFIKGSAATRRCAKCGHFEDLHHYRHPFVALT